MKREQSFCSIPIRLLLTCSATRRGGTASSLQPAIGNPSESLLGRQSLQPLQLPRHVQVTRVVPPHFLEVIFWYFTWKFWNRFDAGKSITAFWIIEIELFFSEYWWSGPFWTKNQFKWFCLPFLWIPGCYFFFSLEVPEWGGAWYLGDNSSPNFRNKSPIGPRKAPAFSLEIWLFFRGQMIGKNRFSPQFIVRNYDFIYIFRAKSGSSARK